LIIHQIQNTILYYKKFNTKKYIIKMKNEMKDFKKKNMLLMKELCLSSMKSYYKEAVEAAQKNDVSYDEFLFELLTHERSERFNRRIERFLKESKLPLEKTLDNYDFKRIPHATRQKAKSILSGDFLSKNENILVFGNPGSGKTHLLCGVARELILNNKRVLFSTCSQLVQQLLISKRELTLNKTLKKLSKFDAVIIDDIGYVQHNRTEMEVLFTFLADRYERGSIMLTSNLPFSKWEKIFKDPMVTTAAIDRLIHHSIIIELNVESYRLKHAKENLKEKK